MIFEVTVSRHLFGNAVPLRAFSSQEEAWRLYELAAKNLKEGQTAYLLGHEGNSVHILAYKTI